MVGVRKTAVCLWTTSPKESIIEPFKYKKARVPRFGKTSDRLRAFFGRELKMDRIEQKSCEIIDSKKDEMIAFGRDVFCHA